MNILIAGGGPAALLAAVCLKDGLPEADITIASLHQDTGQTHQILTNPVTPDLSIANPAVRAALDGVLHQTTGVRVQRPDADTLVPGLAYGSASEANLSAVMMPLARAAGCRLADGAAIHNTSAYDLVLLADPAAMAASGAMDAAFGVRLEESGYRHAVFELSAIKTPLAFGFEKAGAGLIQAMLVPGKDDCATLVIETSETMISETGLDGVDAVELTGLGMRIAAQFDAGARVERCGDWQKSHERKVARRCEGNYVVFASAAASVHHSIALQVRHDLEDAERLAAAISGSVADKTPLADALAQWETSSAARSASYQRAAADSALWLREADRYFDLTAEQFAFACVTRSRRMGYKRVQQAAPEFIRGLDQQVNSAQPASGNHLPPPMFAPYAMRDLDLPNRMVFSPMCMYAATDGTVDDFHSVHLGARAVGGFGLVIAEMTNVTAQGRMTPGCAGMYAAEHVAAWKRVTDYTHKHTQSKIGIQLAHAGRKGSIGRSWEKYDPVKGEDMWEVIAPSALPFTADRPVPREMTAADICETVEAFAKAATMSVEAGFDMIELHMAHGYLISEFISPLANQRSDAYGGSLHKRMRFPLEVYEAVRAVVPQGMPIVSRISATDFDPDGVTPRDSIEISRLLHEAGCDMIAVSTGGVTSARRPTQAQRLYQLSLCEAIRHEAKTPAMAIGGLVSHTDCNMIIASGRADLCVMARGAMNDPYFPHHAANEQGYRFDWPLPYARADETVIKPS